MARRDDRLGGAEPVLTVTRVAATGSTNADLLMLAGRGEAGEGNWLIAEQQTAGRGRLGRPWQSPVGNLFASTLVKVTSETAPALLALAAAVALAEAIPEPVSLKWPNDVMADGAKLAGILLERQGEWVVIGFGVNIASAPALPDRRTSCLAEHHNGLITVDSVFAALEERFAAWVAKWRAGQSEQLVQAWGQLGHARGDELSVRLPDEAVIDGRYDGLEPDGALRLRLRSGETRVIHAGDVALI